MTVQVTHDPWYDGVKRLGQMHINWLGKAFIGACGLAVVKGVYDASKELSEETPPEPPRFAPQPVQYVQPVPAYNPWAGVDMRLWNSALAGQWMDFFSLAVNEFHMKPGKIGRASCREGL